MFHNGPLVEHLAQQSSLSLHTLNVFRSEPLSQSIPPLASIKRTHLLRFLFRGRALQKGHDDIQFVLSKSQSRHAPLSSGNGTLGHGGLRRICNNAKDATRVCRRRRLEYLLMDATDTESLHKVRRRQRN